MRRTQPWEIEPENPRKRVRYPASRDKGNNVAQDGFDRLSTADPRTGIRPTVGGTPVYPPYHEDL